jgi:hypothetical protein
MMVGDRVGEWKTTENGKKGVRERNGDGWDEEKEKEI